MILTEEQVSFIQMVIATANIIRSETNKDSTATTSGISIEPNMVRAVNSNNSAFILQTTGIPDFSFGSVATTRTELFTSRLELLRNLPGFQIEAVIDNFVKSLKMTANKTTSIEFRCSSPSIVRSSRTFKDILKYEVQLNSDAVDLLKRSVNAMKATDVTIKCDNSGASFIIEDDNNDRFEHLFSTTVNSIDDDKPFFTFKYPLKLVLALFQHNSESFKVSENGFLNTVINGLNIYVFPIL